MTFPLVGNDTLQQSLTGLLTTDRLPHAILLEGEAGTGKRTLASYLAKAAVCESDDPPCGICRNCHLAETGNHPDITVIAPEENKKSLTVGQIRATREQAWIKTHMANRRVFIIQQADTMNPQAQNALLKVLEEPPAPMLFLLLVQSRTSLLDTVQSRCVNFSLSVPDRSRAIALLHGRVRKDESVIAEAVDRAGCNIGKALTLLGKKDKNSAQAGAEKILDLVFSGSEWELLSAFYPFEKDRKSADELFAFLKTGAVGQMKCSVESVPRSKFLCALYEEFDHAEALLKTNINLSLLFSALTCKINALKNMNLY